MRFVFGLFAIVLLAGCDCDSSWDKMNKVNHCDNFCHSNNSTVKNFSVLDGQWVCECTDDHKYELKK